MYTYVYINIYMYICIVFNMSFWYFFGDQLPGFESIDGYSKRNEAVWVGPRSSRKRCFFPPVISNSMDESTDVSRCHEQRRPSSSWRIW